MRVIIFVVLYFREGFGTLGKLARFCILGLFPWLLDISRLARDYKYYTLSPFLNNSSGMRRDGDASTLTGG
jgi:hypothetical protein